MKVWHGIEHYPHYTKPACATIGNYDGVHLGHRTILEQVIGQAESRRASSLLITFEPHPLSVVAPHLRPVLLQTREQNLQCLEATGLEAVLILEFTEEMARLTGDAFFTEVLGDRVPLASVSVGTNFRFGRERSGDIRLLQQIGQDGNFDVFEIPPVKLQGRTVSSSAIRRMIMEGDVENAALMLDRPYTMSGVIERGVGRGRKLSYPTANLKTANELVPKPGVYITETVVCASRNASVTNVGTRPTFDGEGLTIESHLIDFEGDIYDERTDLRFLARLRDEMKFLGPSGLSDQIGRDLAAAVAYFENVRIVS